MAVDDVTTVITVNMAQGDTTDRQPGSGVEELFLAGAEHDAGGTVPNAVPVFSLKLVDGTNNDADYIANGTTGEMAVLMYTGKYMADNTNFFRVTKEGANTGDYGFAVIAVG